MHWYVVNTKASHEKQVEKHIQHLGIECFLPLLQEQRVIRRQPKIVIAPLFPGYLFVRVNLMEHYRALTYARGVRKIVGFGSNPVIVDQVVVDAIKGKMTNSRIYVPEKPKTMEDGQLVQITEGPLVGLEAVFMHEISGQQRAMVLLHTLAIQARAVVDIDQLALCVAA